MFSFNNFKKKRNINDVDLRLNTTTITFNYLIFIVNNDSKLKTLITLSKFTYYEVKFYRFH